MQLTDLRNGLLLVDKPVGCTSHDVVNRVRKILNMRSVGHSGTLDPIASGLMVLLLGDATKLSDFVLNEDKRYQVRIQFGHSTDTHDRTGQVVLSSDVKLTEAAIRIELERTIGEFDWPVPSFSAVKFQGRKLYDYARKGEAVVTPLRSMRFFDLDIIDVGPDWAVADVSCSKGSYVRSWAHQIGLALGAGGVVDQLRRLRSEPFSVEDALTLEQLEAGHQLDRGFIPMGRALPHLKSVLVLNNEKTLLRNGQIARSLAVRMVPIVRDALDRGQPAYLKAFDDRGLFMAILEAGENGLRVRRNFMPILGPST